MRGEARPAKPEPTAPAELIEGLWRRRRSGRERAMEGRASRREAGCPEAWTEIVSCREPQVLVRKAGRRRRP